MKLLIPNHLKWVMVKMPKPYWLSGKIGTMETWIHPKGLFADSVTFLTGDGSVISGPLDSAFGAMKSYREMFTTIKSTVTAILPVKSTDKNENWVSIWGNEINTDKKGKTDSVALQESWRFNKDGKIDLFIQHMRVLKPAGK